MLLVFWIIFSVPVISRIESIGGGQEAGMGGKPKQPFGLKQQCCTFSFSMGSELVQSTGWAKTAIRSSLVPHAVLLMPLRAEKCILMVLQHR